MRTEKPEARVRMSLNVTEKVRTKMEALRVRCGAETLTETIRRALEALEREVGK